MNNYYLCLIAMLLYESKLNKDNPENKKINTWKAVALVSTGVVLCVLLELLKKYFL